MCRPSAQSRKELIISDQPKPAQFIPPGEYSGNSIECSHGVAVCVSTPASDVGVSVLRRGGNAVDAAVATAFALTVTFPAAGNIGGGGFMLVHPAPGQGDPVAFIYREAAPAAATPTMFTEKDTQYSHKAVAVPGTVRGLAAAHRRFGTLPWSQLLQPAIRLATEGFPINASLTDLLSTYLADANTANKTEFKRVFGKPGGGLWAPGDRLVQPDLAKTLRLLADQGPDAFYTGPIAAGIVAEMARDSHSLITAKDLADYRAIECKALTTRYRGKYDVYVPPPPSGGGTTLLEELNIIENFDLTVWGRWSPTTLHVMAETMRRATYDRVRYLGDPAFVSIPDKLMNPEYGRQLAKTIDLMRATRSKHLDSDIPETPEGADTTQFSIIDKQGMAVANTYTLERLWGSRIVVKGMGFLLNNNMFGFNLFPNEMDPKNADGLNPNAVVPGKRPLSSQTPTIVAQNGHVRLITGSPGSRSIPNTVLSLIINVFDFNMPIEKAVAFPRFSNEWMPDQINFETPELYPDMVKALTAIGHTIVRKEPRPQGDAHSIFVKGPNDYIGAADTRRNLQARATGY
jgi:gamma-glutamyltranspeptidase / glutathione hydrolase